MLVPYRPAAAGACRHVASKPCCALEDALRARLRTPSAGRQLLGCEVSTRYQKVTFVRMTPDLRKREMRRAWWLVQVFQNSIFCLKVEILSIVCLKARCAPCSFLRKCQPDTHVRVAVAGCGRVSSALPTPGRGRTLGSRGPPTTLSVNETSL